MMDPTQVPNANTCMNRKMLFSARSPSPHIVLPNRTELHSAARPQQLVAPRPDTLPRLHSDATKLFEHTCPFRFSHRLTIGGRTEQWGEWWATKDLNLGPLPCEGSALTTELVAHAVRQFRGRTEIPEKFPKAVAVAGATCMAVP